MWQAWTNAVLGLWLMVAAFLGFGPTANLWDNLIVGLVVAIASVTILKQKPWQAWLALIFGVWMIIAAFIPSLVDGTGYLYNDLTSGLIIAIAGFASFGQSHQQKVA
ncbi:MAG: SPW repeat domain-containing protein [Candidatus Kryptoniota bacterium]